MEDKINLFQKYIENRKEKGWQFKDAMDINEIFDLIKEINDINVLYKIFANFSDLYAIGIPNGFPWESLTTMAGIPVLVILLLYWYFQWEYDKEKTDVGKKKTDDR